MTLKKYIYIYSTYLEGALSVRVAKGRLTRVFRPKGGLGTLKILKGEGEHKFKGVFYFLSLKNKKRAKIFIGVWRGDPIVHNKNFYLMIYIVTCQICGSN